MREAVFRDKLYQERLIFDLHSSVGKVLLAEGRKPFLECTASRILSRGFFGIPTGVVVFDTKQSFLDTKAKYVEVFSLTPRYDKLFTVERTGKEGDWRLRSGLKGKKLFMDIRGGKVLQVARMTNGNPRGRIEHGRIEGFINAFTIVSLWYFYMGGLYMAAQRKAGNEHFFGERLKIRKLSSWVSGTEKEAEDEE